MFNRHQTTNTIDFERLSEKSPSEGKEETVAAG